MSEPDAPPRSDRQNELERLNRKKNMLMRHLYKLYGRRLGSTTIEDSLETLIEEAIKKYDPSWVGPDTGKPATIEYYYEYLAKRRINDWLRKEGFRRCEACRQERDQAIRRPCVCQGGWIGPIQFRENVTLRRDPIIEYQLTIDTWKSELAALLVQDEDSDQLLATYSKTIQSAIQKIRKTLSRTKQIILRKSLQGHAFSKRDSYSCEELAILDLEQKMTPEAIRKAKHDALKICGRILPPDVATGNDEDDGY